MANPASLSFNQLDLLARAATAQSTTVSELPDEVCLAILKYLPETALSCMAQTCRQWRLLCTDDCILQPMLRFHGMDAPKAKGLGMMGVHDAFFARAQICLDSIDLAVEDRERNGKPRNVSVPGCLPCQAVLVGDPEIQAAGAESPIKRLRALVHFLLSTRAQQCRADKLVEEALLLSIEDNHPNQTQALLDAETRLCIPPFLVRDAITRATCRNTSACLSHLTKQQDRSVQDPQYMQRYTLFEIEREAPHTMLGGLSHIQFDISSALRYGYIDCAALLLLRCKDPIQTIRSIQQQYIPVANYPAASLAFMDSITGSI